MLQYANYRHYHGKYFYTQRVMQHQQVTAEAAATLPSRATQATIAVINALIEEFQYS